MSSSSSRLHSVAKWGAYYRENPHRLAKEYLGVSLKWFQSVMLYEMCHNQHVIFWGARSIGKTFLLALFCVIRCILYPGSKIVIVGPTRKQGTEVLEKIEKELMQMFGIGSENLRREISSCKIGVNAAEITFHNGSWIRVATASENARGMRANVLIVDEFRMVNKDVLDLVMKRLLGNSRHPGYLDKPEYARQSDKYLESNIEMYASSAWLASHWSFTKTKAYFANMILRGNYFVCALPYQLAVKEGLKKRSDIEDEMSELDFDETKFSLEMGTLPLNDAQGAFFNLSDIERNRRIKSAVYPDKKIPELAEGERRILSVDIALMASTKHNNDASSVMINFARKENGGYTGRIVYLENYEGLKVNELALIVRRLYNKFHCTDLVIDCAGVGLGVYDLLIQDMSDPDTGYLYPALTCCNNREMAARCSVPYAEPVIWSVKASDRFNNDISVLLRSGLKQGKMRLLVNEYEVEECLKSILPGYEKMPVHEQLAYKMPYVQTTLLMYELVNLQYETKGTNIRVFEKSGMRKDRYSALAYNYWVQCEIEREAIRVAGSGFDISEYVKQMSRLTRKPKIY